MGILDQIPLEYHAEAVEVIQDSPDLQDALQTLDESFYSTFLPRPDKPELFDQQAAFCYSRDKVAFLVGGNAAGTTEASAWKVAKFILQDQPPPRPDTPYWIISNIYDQCCGVCWYEKLLGNGHIPASEVDWDRTRWYRAKQGWPFAIHLKPWPKDRKGGNGRNSWMLEFKSYEQGRTALQAKSIGGFWFSEQFPWQLFTETLRGCRDYMFDGGQMCEFTPIDPELCYHLEKVMLNPPSRWGFYRANTDCNLVNLKGGEEWYESFFGSMPEEMVETRRTGALATFEGVIYAGFNPAVHVVDGDTVFPKGVRHYRGIDWGASAEHPFTCVWGYVDGIGNWYAYDEYWSDSQTKITLDHVVEIVEKSHDWGWPGEWMKDSKIGPVWVPIDSQSHCLTFADPSRPGEINEFGNRGIPIQGAANDVFKGIDTVRSLLKVQTDGKPKLLIHKRCVHLIEELRKYRWMRGKKSLITGGSLLNPQVAAPQPLKRDDDLADAFRYMVHTQSLSCGMAPSSMSHRDWSQRRRSIQVRQASGGGLQLDRGDR